MKKDVYELTNPQKSIWYTEQFYNKSNINNITGYLKINKNTNFKALEKAFNCFVLKNDSFKTKIIVDGTCPKQYFDDFIYENIEIIDLKDDTQLAEFEESFPMQHINVLNNFLFLTKILRFPDGSGILVLIAHHLISDAWTMSLVLEEIYQNYIDIISGKTIDANPNPSYIEFIKSQKKYLETNKYDLDREFWQEQFKVLPNIVSFKNNIKSSINSNRKIFSINKSLADKISLFCKEHNITDYIFLLSIFSIYFGNIFNTDNFVIGNPILNRSNFREKHMTGMFVSTMPFIIELNKSNTFIDLCSQMTKNQRTLYRHIKYSYHEILDFIRKKHNFSDSLYDIVFSYQNATIPSYCKWIPNHSQAESLQIHIKNISIENNNLSIHYDFLTDIFSEKDIELLHERILWIINQVLENPCVCINNIEVISKPEKKLLESFNKTNSSYNKNSNIVKAFENIVKKYPQNIAVIDKNGSYTYEELNNRANFLAKYIIDKNITTDIIAFSLNRTVDIVITILGILKSGHAYMPIDPEYPIERINFMLENSKTKLLITTENFSKKITYDQNYILFEKLLFNETIKNLNINISNSDHCYIMYTSGSTGIPKAVTINHYNVLNFIKSMQDRLDYIPSQNNKVISVTTVCFDIFVFELYPTLLSGLTLVIADELESRSPKLLSQVIQKHKISKILTTPSRIELLFSNNSYLDSLTCIKEFLLGGEPLPELLLGKLQKHTNARIINLYGPTETTVYSTFKDVTNTNLITVGKPINNTQVYILNNNNQLQPIGNIGEICIGGDGVGSGYYLNQEKTKNVFIQNPLSNDILYKTGDLGYWNLDGELICLGRKDHQVKIRGYRVELDDINSHILNYEGIKNCIVIDKTDKNGKKYLCAYIVCNKNIDITDLKKYLVDVLPHYMIPTYFVELDNIPLTLNHKIDRKALPEPDINNINRISSYKKPSTKIERNLCDIFKECLSISKIGIEDDIFNFNIDSLDIIKIQTKMLEYNYKLNTQKFYKYRTIEKLAQLLEENQKESKLSDIDENYLSNINNSFHKHPHTMQFCKKDYTNILLLGSTGYLGIHILYELLHNSDCHITCIIRSKNSISPIDRLLQLYKFYFNKKLPLNRITVIDSDITKPNFGLGIRKYKELGTSIDLTINSAANVKYYGNYEEFKKINVDVVQNSIDFSMQNDIELIHISTLGVSGNYLVKHKQNYNNFDENNFYIGQNYNENVYIQTKFEAEKLIYEKSNQGLLASIFRVGNLTSRYSDGGFQQNFESNAFYNILMMILHYHILPNTMLNEFLEFTPVDYCAKSIIDLAFNVDTNKYVFHLFNDNYIAVSELLNIFKSLGFETTILSGNEFKQRILTLSNKYSNENILKGIVNDLDDTLGLSYLDSVNQKNINTNSCLEKLDFRWPIITKEYIEKIIEYLRRKKYLQ